MSKTAIDSPEAFHVFKAVIPATAPNGLTFGLLGKPKQVRVLGLDRSDDRFVYVDSERGRMRMLHRALVFTDEGKVKFEKECRKIRSRLSASSKTAQATSPLKPSPARS
jgi:hypothetical protein